MRPLILLLVLLSTNAAQSVRLYPDRNVPLANPAAARAWTKTPSGIGELPHFCAYRGCCDSNALDAYNRSGMGDVIWCVTRFFYPHSTIVSARDPHLRLIRPQYPALPSIVANAANLAQRGLWVVDVSNYVPGDAT